MKHIIYSIALGMFFIASSYGGGYVGVGVGASAFDVDLGSSARETDGSDAGFKLYGGYFISGFFAIEGGYADLGSFEMEVSSLKNVKFDSSTSYLALVGRIPFAAIGGIFAKAGLNRFKMDTKDSLGVSLSDSDSKSYLAAGIDIDFPVIGVRAEYERFNSESSLWSAGVYYRF